MLIVGAPPMAAAFFRGVLGQFQPYSPFGLLGRSGGAPPQRNFEYQPLAAAERSSTGTLDPFGHVIGDSLARSSTSGDLLGGFIAKNNNWADVSATPTFAEDRKARLATSNPYGLPTSNAAQLLSDPGWIPSSGYEDAGSNGGIVTWPSSIPVQNQEAALTPREPSFSDSATDAEVMAYQMRQAGYGPDWDSAATGWSMRDASADAMRRSELEYQARIASGPQLSLSNSPTPADLERTRINLGMALAGPVVGAGIGVAAYAGGSAFLAGQLAKVPAAELGYSQLATGMATSGIFSAATYTLLNGGESTPAGLAIAFSSGAIGGGLVKPALNFAAHLPNTAVPLRLSNFVTQGTGSAFGFGTIGWLNTAGVVSSGQSWWTQPIYPSAKPSLGKP
jgi:hypothetical protein